MSPGQARGTGMVRAGEPDYAVPPGESLRIRLEELGMSQAELARRTGLTTKHVNQVMQGIASLSADVAQKLEYATGTPSHWWLRLEADYRSATVRIAQREALAADVSWAKAMPVKDLVRVGALPDTPTDKVSRVQQLLSFFGVADVNAYDLIWGTPVAAFRQSRAYEIDRHAVAAWLRLGEIAARAQSVARYDANALKKLLPHIRSFTRLAPRTGIEELVRSCAAVGLRVVFVPEIAGARAYGVTRWLSPREPMIQLSLRGRSDNKLWETVFHELGHVLLHDHRAMFVESDTDDDANPQDLREIEASEFARETLIPADKLERLSELTTIEDALDFADQIDIAPGIVVGRLQSRGFWSYRQGNSIKRTINDHVLPLFSMNNPGETVTYRAGQLIAIPPEEAL
ncbi:ImmA/IrrE family metallo-endopeptidase [Mycobacteroides abscessus]|uniref:ImmA/IrrE family metallo-endopeptidase n=1 Tax=Mycobacteroides abscessus TaxID=36809 RepID=UPI0009A892A6|nr:ImmA/IrrE family metallo-endopeptidase [Mycobacteroides abscessus]RIT40453.1 ImmA/IrrE family metallo-endopeptidase [Mycobacteroides abscessus]SKT91529.1 plasmid maintenance system antidote protein [Mycobacteroides abscessus subsp. massiliense]SKU10429.1 plasmid maintenance system antidote protein [Mycobacteroides abscessus subsp. massiliense]